MQVLQGFLKAGKAPLWPSSWGICEQQRRSHRAECFVNREGENEVCGEAEGEDLNPGAVCRVCWQAAGQAKCLVWGCEPRQGLLDVRRHSLKLWVHYPSRQSPNLAALAKLF